MNLADAIRRASGAESSPAAAPAAPAAPAPVFESPMPEPPQVNSGNVVRLELFLSGEQMAVILKSLLAGQHSILTLREAAAYLRIPQSALAELAEANEVPGVSLDGRWRFPKNSLDDWLIANSSASESEFQNPQDQENVA
jgi:excisionase family DNA binding protein